VTLNGNIFDVQKEKSLLEKQRCRNICDFLLKFEDHFCLKPSVSKIFFSEYFQWGYLVLDIFLI